MKFQIRWKDCDRSRAVESAVKDALASLAKYDFIGENIKVEIVHYPKTELFKTRINVHVKGGKVLRSEATAATIYGATNTAVDKTEDQLRRAKTKIHSRTSKKAKSALRRYK